MILSLIGMSNAGKTYWSKQLEAIGFTRFGVDDQIDEWLLASFQIGSRVWEEDCVCRERNVVENILERLPNQATRVVIDTPGSIIYLHPTVRSELCRRSTMVYLETSPLALAEMIERYFQYPKPLIWAEHFSPQPGEPLEATIRRCYPALLAWRSARYRELADVVIPDHAHRNPTWTARDLLYAILQHP
jgi:shikimate kinase